MLDAGWHKECPAKGWWFARVIGLIQCEQIVKTQVISQSHKSTTSPLFMVIHYLGHRLYIKFGQIHFGKVNSENQQQTNISYSRNRRM
jgi:hypothetical protein